MNINSNHETSPLAYQKSLDELRSFVGFPTKKNLLSVLKEGVQSFPLAINQVIGKNDLLDKISHKACECFTTFQDQPFFDRNSALNVLLRLIQKNNCNEEMGLRLVSIYQNILAQEKKSTRSYSQQLLTEYAPNYFERIPHEVITDCLLPFLSDQDKHQFGLVSKSCRDLENSVRKILSQVLLSTKPGYELSDFDFRLADIKKLETIDFQDFKKTLPDNFKLKTALDNLLSMSLLIETDSNEEKLLLYLMQHLPFLVDQVEKVVWLKKSQVSQVIVNLYNFGCIWDNKSLSDEEFVKALKDLTIGTYLYTEALYGKSLDNPSNAFGARCSQLVVGTDRVGSKKVCGVALSAYKHKLNDTLLRVKSSKNLQEYVNHECNTLQPFATNFQECSNNLEEESRDKAIITIDAYKRTLENGDKNELDLLLKTENDYISYFTSQNMLKALKCVKTVNSLNRRFVELAKSSLK